MKLSNSLIIINGICLVALIGCKPVDLYKSDDTYGINQNASQNSSATPDENKHYDNSLVSFVDRPQVHTPTVQRDPRVEASKVVKRIEFSKARLAAQTTYKCPKLITFENGVNSIKRPNEVLMNDYCDYLIYPHKGDRISVSSATHNIEAVLVSPIVYDFADGDYLVKQYDQHIIRLSYRGSEFRDNLLNYSVSINIE